MRDNPLLLEADITSDISEIKFLISNFSIVDFRFSTIAICDFLYLISDLSFLNSDFSSSGFRVLIFKLLSLISG